MQAGMLAERYPKCCLYILLFPRIFKVSQILSSEFHKFIVKIKCHLTYRTDHNEAALL